MTSLRSVSALLLACVIPSLGCSNTIAVRKPVTAAEAQEVTSAVDGRDVKVEVLTSAAPNAGAEVQSGSLSTRDDGSFTLRPPNEAAIDIPFERTRSVSFEDRGKGAGEGALVGFFPGLIGGIAMGSAVEALSCSSCDGNPCPPSSPCKNGGSTTLLLGLGLGAVTALIGAGIGALIGHRTTFTF